MGLYGTIYRLGAVSRRVAVMLLMLMLISNIYAFAYAFAYVATVAVIPLFP
jgi:hypothetical protein